MEKRTVRTPEDRAIFKGAVNKSSPVLDPPSDILPDSACREPVMTARDVEDEELYLSRSLKQLAKPLTQPIGEN